MLVLGIETSCDETAAAVVNENREVLSNKVYSQQQEHARFGGVVPEIAARAHLDVLDGIICDALQDARVTLEDINGIAATCGPGLIGGVIVGSTMAKAMSAAANIPFIAVNHLEAHALTARLTHGIDFPYLLLLVSGGHCQLLIVEGLGHYKLLGETADDAIGEAFDKCGKMLGLGFPGGPAIEKAAVSGNPARFSFPRPMKGRPGCDFSFSGLKTSVRQCILSMSVSEASYPDVCDVAASFQEAVSDIILDRCENAIKMFREQYRNGNTLVVSGGVGANLAIRKQLALLCDVHNFVFIAPPPELCTDNGAMIAWAGIERFQNGLVNGLDIAPRPRWPLEELRHF